jgi:predicted phosphodiesterase
MRKFIAVSCSHGELIKASARYELLTFCEQFKPDTTLHLGDFIDTSAFRAGANHTEGSNVSMDVEAGFAFLREFLSYGQKRYTFCGNHEDRLWRLANDTRPLVSELAQRLINDIYALTSKLNSPLFEYRDGTMWRLLGDTMFGHGQMFNEFAARDHAEMLGRSCVFGHTHKIVESPSRCNHQAVGYNIGWLGDVSKADYAKTRRATKGWANGFAWGYYDDKRCIVNLYKCRKVVKNEETTRIG